MRDGHDKVAEHIASCIAKAGVGCLPVVIRDDGAVRIYPRVQKLPASEEQFLIGTYSKTARLDLIRGDCLSRMMELG